MNVSDFDSDVAFYSRLFGTGPAKARLEQLHAERFGLGHTTLQVDHGPDELLTIQPDPR